MDNTQLIGQITEQKCLLKCIECGWVVSKPLFDSARYDFIADTGSRLLRIQIKTSTWNEDKSAFNFRGYSQHSTSGGNKRMKYTNKEIDYFMTEKDDKFYLYPAEDKGFTSRTFRVSCTKPQDKMVWAENYLFEEVSKNL